MSFGPEIEVIRHKRIAGKANVVQLGPFSTEYADPYFPLPLDDPAVRLTFDGEVLRQQSSAALLKERLGGKDKIAWGIWHSGQFAGVIDVVKGAVDSLRFGILLFPGHRGKGVGTLTVAGVTEMVFRPGYIASTIREADDTIRSIYTWIHPENQPSLAVCTALGFVAVHDPRSTLELSGVPLQTYVLPALTPSVIYALGISYPSARSAWLSRSAVVEGLDIRD